MHRGTDGGLALTYRSGRKGHVRDASRSQLHKLHRVHPHARVQKTVWPATESQMSQDRCEQCAQPTAAYDAIHYGSVEGGYRLLCTQCFNAEVARRNGVTDF